MSGGGPGLFRQYPNKKDPQTMTTYYVRSYEGDTTSLREYDTLPMAEAEYRRLQGMRGVIGVDLIEQTPTSGVVVKEWTA
jgi:hypothetical protein